MSPERRAALDALLAEARSAAEARRARIAALPDEALAALTGIPDAALARRVAATARVAARLALPQGEPTDASSVSDEPKDDQTESALRTDPEPGAQVTDPVIIDEPPPHGLLAALACAIGFSALDGWPGAATIDETRNVYGDEAVAFGLAHRTDVPDWMRLAAGRRHEMHRQLAATALRSVEAAPQSWLRLADQHDPLTVADGAARQSAAHLATLAQEFLRATPGTSTVTHGVIG